MGNFDNPDMTATLLVSSPSRLSLHDTTLRLQRSCEDNKLISLLYNRAWNAEDSGRDLYPVRNDSVGVRSFDRGSNAAITVFLPAVPTCPETYCHVKEEKYEGDLGDISDK